MRKTILQSLLFTAVFLCGVFVISQQPVKAASIDLREYYPNPQLYENYYLEGMNNRVIGSPVRSVIWFSKENSEGTIFKQYNYGPEDAQKDCHWDLLSWDGGFLNYSETYDGCDTNDKTVSFSTPIQFLPRYWDDSGTWTRSGTTTQTTTKFDGSPGCVGTNNWTSTILGKETVASGVQAIHWRTEQTIDWTSGDDSPNCVHDSTTNWQEDIYLADSIAVNNYTGLSSAPGLYRTVGGNLDTFTGTGLHDWDITMSHWALLPWGVAQEIPGVPNTGSSSSSKIIVPALLLSLSASATVALLNKRRVLHKK